MLVAGQHGFHDGCVTVVGKWLLQNGVGTTSFGVRDCCARPLIIEGLCCHLRARAALNAQRASPALTGVATLASKS